WRDGWRRRCSVWCRAWCSRWGRGWATSGVETKARRTAPPQHPQPEAAKATGRLLRRG
ncbi:MAG: hypothetical protein AVDCRST_MAG73-2809, partial [uncultured Thermomicrobiales bacterium]